jgi:protein TonB
MSAISVRGGYQGARYGAIELKQSYQRYWYIALCIAATIHFGVVGSFYILELLPKEKPHAIVNPVVRITNMGPPPSIANSNSQPAIAVSDRLVKPRAGIPVPVPDATVDPDQTIARNADLNPSVPSVNDGPGTAVGPEIHIDDDAPPPDFRAVQNLPVVIRRVQPLYPQLAIRAGMEGKVVLNIWVDREGKVRQVVLLKSSAEIFNQPSIDAAKQWVFTPAYMNNGPVSVWVSVPFKFRLADNKEARPENEDR